MNAGIPFIGNVVVMNGNLNLHPRRQVITQHFNHFSARRVALIRLLNQLNNNQLTIFVFKIFIRIRHHHNLIGNTLVLWNQ